MRKARLLKLAALLEADAANPTGAKFDLGYWGKSTTKKMALSCGTSACAMGVAALSGAFKHQGLKWAVDINSRCDCEVCRDKPRDFQMEIICNGRDGLEAAVELFGITTNEAGLLFMPDEYPIAKRKGQAGELAVAKRIRDFVDGKDLKSRTGAWA